MTALPAPRADAADLYFAEVERMCAGDPALSALGAGILVGIAFDIAHDSRAFARTLGIEHAIVLREVQGLVAMGRLTITRRDERTHRCGYALAADARPWLLAGNDRA